jgi:hypothetical protein
MIIWYRPSERMPEDGDAVIWVLYVFEEFYLRYYIHNDTEFPHGEFWTYAKDFNFPKDEK